jgi:hypothetical protein
VISASAALCFSSLVAVVDHDEIGDDHIHEVVVGAALHLL